MSLFKDLNKVKSLSKHINLNHVFDTRHDSLDINHKHINIIIINTCNLHCKFCRGGMKPDILREQSRVKTMPTLIFQTIVDKCVMYGVKSIDLTPPIGELMLDPTIYEKLDILETNENISSFVFTTNFLKVQREDIEKFKSYKKMILFISVYGYDDSSYEHSTNKDKFNVFVNNLEVLYNSCLEGKGNLDIHFMLRCDLENTDIYFALLKLCYKFGFKICSFEKNNMNRAGNVEGEMPDKDSRKGICPYGPLLGGGIDQNGDVIFCPFNDIEKKGIVGNIFKNSLQEIYNGEKWKYIVDSHKNNDYNVSICKLCNETW